MLKCALSCKVCLCIELSVCLHPSIMEIMTGQIGWMSYSQTELCSIVLKNSGLSEELINLDKNVFVTSQTTAING